MKIDKKTILPYLAKAAVCAGGRTASTPGLGIVWLKKDANTLHINSYGLDMAYESTITLPENDGQSWAFGAEAQRMLSVLQALPGQDVQLRPDDERLIVQAGRTRMRIDTQPYDPAEWDMGDEPLEVSITASRLLNGIRSAQHAMARDDVRYYLNGMLFETDHPDGGYLNLVATDGHRLAFEQRAAAIHGPEDARLNVIVPHLGIGALLKAVPDTDENIRLMITQRSLRVLINERETLMLKLLDGKFPDYRRVIREASKDDTTLVIETEPMENALSRLIANLPPRVTRGLKLSIEDEAVRLEHTSNQLEFEDVVELQQVKGKPNDPVGVDAAYLRDALKSLDGVTEIHIADPTQSIILRSDRPSSSMSEAMSLRIVMPMRL